MRVDMERCRRLCAHVALAACLFSATSVSGSNDLRLVEAVKHGDAQAVSALLTEADVNAREPDGATALLWAVQWDDLETADLLIRAGAHVDVANDYGVTPLWMAATNGSAAMIEKLLNAGADPNSALPNGETVVMTAARTGRVDAVTALLSRGARVDGAEDVKGQTALMWALSERHLDVAEALIASGADVQARSTSGFSPILFAARQGDLDAVKMLLDRGADVGETALDGTSVLHMATVRGHVELVEFLLDQGVDPNADGNGYTPLHWAAGWWETATTRDYSVREWSRLAGLPEEERMRLLEALLAGGANVNARTTRNPPRFGSSAWKIHGGGSAAGATPLFFAAMTGDIEVMRLLLDHGADPLLPTVSNTSPLMGAAGLAVEESETLVSEQRHLDAVKMLHALGGDIHAANDQGNTVLHGAAFLGYDSIVQYLVDEGVELNRRNNMGQTPYKIASGIEVTMMFFQHPSTEALLRELGGVE